jgi:O-antigen/teichoic acid export membrane protein
MAMRAVNQLSFNLYSRVQDDASRLARACGLVNYFLVRASFAVTSAFVVFPEPAIRFLLGDAWVDAAPMLRWLGLYIALASTLDNLQWLLYARREVHRNVQLRLIQIGVLAPGILAAMSLGSVSGVAVSVSASTLAALAAAVWFNRGIVGRAGVRQFVTAALLLIVAASASTALSAAGALEGAPEILLPLLPPAVFAALILATERVTLFRELAYLRAQLAEPRGAGGVSDAEAPRTG